MHYWPFWFELIESNDCLKQYMLYSHALIIQSMLLQCLQMWQSEYFPKNT